MSDYLSRKWKAICCCMLIAILTGCAKAPEEVLDEINNMVEPQESVDNLEQTEDGIVYTKVSELSESLPEYLTTTRGNLSFDGTITVPDTDCLYDLRLMPNASFYENRETLIPDILAWYQLPRDDWDGGNYEIECWVDHESGTSIGLPDGESTEDYMMNFLQLVISDLYIGINNCGSIVLVDHWGEGREYLGINHFWQESVMVETYETWHLWNHEMPEIEIAFDEETVSLQELYEDFGQIVELYNSQNDSLGYQICSASYYLSEDQEVCVHMEALQTYKDVCFDPVECSQVIDASGRSLVSGRLRGMYHCREDRCLFSLGNNSYIPVEELAAYDEVVSFDSALDLLAERLGDYYNADIDEASLFYLRYYYGTYGFAWSQVEEEPITAYAHPYWRFVERSDGNDIFHRTVYYVDAITGEVMCLYENCGLY